MKLGKNNTLVLVLEDGSLNVEEAKKILNKTVEFSNEALFFLKPEFKTAKSLKEFSWFYNLHHELILSYNKIGKIDFSKEESLRYERVISIVFNDESWAEEHFFYPSDLKKEMAFLLSHLTPKPFLSMLKFKTKTLELLNVKIFESWLINMCVIYEAKLHRMLKKQVVEKMNSVVISVLATSFDSLNSDQARKFTKTKKRLIILDDLEKLFKYEIAFWEMLTVRANYSISPNKIYTDEMFKMTSEYIVKGYREYVAFDLTLEHFEFNSVEKRESYRKAYKKNLKNKF